MAQWVSAAISLLIFESPVEAQETENPYVRLFRGINALQDPSSNGFIEYLDLTSLPTFGALPVGFVIVGVAR
jgi:hypothetical protein